MELPIAIFSSVDNTPNQEYCNSLLATPTWELNP